MPDSQPQLITVTLADLAGTGKQATDLLTRRILARNENTVVIQATLPADADIPPHGLPAGKTAILTLLRGQLSLALGSEFDATALKPIEQGGMALFNPGDPQHYGRTGADGADILVVAFEPEAATDTLKAFLGHD